VGVVGDHDRTVIHQRSQVRDCSRSHTPTRCRGASSLARSRHITIVPPTQHVLFCSCSRVKICSSEFPPRLQVNRQSVMPHVRAQRDARRPHGAVGSPASVCIREKTSQHCVDERRWAVGLHDQPVGAHRPQNKSLVGVAGLKENNE
jgi:hypothetical protein